MARCTTTTDNWLCSVRIPRAASAVWYRPYKERLDHDVTVLDWSLGRLRMGLPSKIPIVCICETDDERDHIAQAHTDDEPLFVEVRRAATERHLCEQLVETYGVDAILMCGLGHSVAGPVLRDALWRAHLLVAADITEIVEATFADSMFMVASACVHRLRANDNNGASGGLSERAFSQTAVHARERPAIRRVRLSASKELGIERYRWPEQIALTSARDIDVLRAALVDPLDVARPTLIDAWKKASIRIRHNRLSSAVPSSRRPAPRAGRPRRVLYASSSSTFTGAQQSLCQMIAALDRRRYEPLAIVSHSGEFTERLRSLDVPVLCPEERIGCGRTENIASAKRVFDTYSPDVIHANHNIGMPLVAAAIHAGVPLVQHVRISTPADIRPQLHAASAIIAVSRFVRDRVAALDVDPRRIEVVLNGIAYQQFTAVTKKMSTHARTAVLESPADEFVVIMVARMSKSKRHDTVIDAVGALRRQTGRGHLALVGGYDGDQEYLNAVHSRVIEQGLARHVTFVDFTSDIATVLSASDVLVLLSEDEPLSRAVIEAMALGLPVICGDSGGTKEIIDHDRTGYVLPCGNVELLVKTLHGVQQDPERASMVGAAAANYIRSELTSDRCAQRTMDLYDRLFAD
jgi:glycosyltransferase involved in cell wall biosynthesis